MSIAPVCQSDTSSPSAVNERSAGWMRFARQLHFDTRYLLFVIGILQLVRCLMLLMFRQRLLGLPSAPEALIAWVTALRFDAQVAAYFVIPSFALSLSCLFRDRQRRAERTRAISLGVFIVSAVLLGAVNAGYFREFDDQFNHYLFGVLYDDFLAVLVTVWKQHPVVWGLLGLTAVIAALFPIGRRLVIRDWMCEAGTARLTRSWPRRLFLIGISLAVFVVAIRGSVRSRPIQAKDAAVTRDHVLNKLIPNHFSAMSIAINRQRKLESSTGLQLFVPDGGIAAVAQAVSGQDEPLTNVDDALRRVAKGPKGLRPRHVFYLEMESYDAWPTLDRYRSLGLAERLMDYGRRGIFSRKFLSASSGTMTTFAAMLTGLTDVGVFTNYQPSTRKPFPTSINPILQQLGLRTRMFVGGYASWQRSSEFCMEQGFQEYYAAAHFSQKISSNEWGPDDRDLFDFALHAVDPNVPSFNFIMTATYHPPYSVDVYAHGFPHREMPDDLKSIATDDPEYLRILGHLWYSDQVLGDFIEAAEKKFPDSLFIITGDHTSRKFLNGHPTLYERTVVPFVMYGPSVLKDIPVPDDLVGSHHDVMPTVFELLAPRGFVYHALGRDLLDPERPQIGFGRDQIIGRNFIASRQPGGEIEPLPGEPLPESIPDLPRLQADYKALLGIAWWRICRGADLPEKDSSPTRTDSVNVIATQPNTTPQPR